MFMDKKVTFIGLGKPPGTQGTEKGVERNQGLSGGNGNRKHSASRSQCPDAAFQHRCPVDFLSSSTWADTGSLQPTECGTSDSGAQP